EACKVLQRARQCWSAFNLLLRNIRSCSRFVCIKQWIYFGGYRNFIQREFSLLKGYMNFSSFAEFNIINFPLSGVKANKSHIYLIRTSDPNSFYSKPTVRATGSTKLCDRGVATSFFTCPDYRWAVDRDSGTINITGSGHLGKDRHWQ